MRHTCDMVTRFYITMTSQNDVWLARGCSLFIFPRGWYGVREIEFSYMGQTAKTTGVLMGHYCIKRRATRF